MRILFFLLIPLKLFSQDLQGMWTGTIYNDTTHRYIPYEIAISENKGKLSGFSHTVFTSADNLQETGIKSLKIKKKEDKVLFEDDELIYNNYKEPPPKGVRQYSVLNVIQSDSGLLLVGVFNTNRTKEYSSLTGTIRLRKKDKIDQTKLYPKLDELKLSKSLSFLPEKEKDLVVVADKKKDAATLPASPLPGNEKKDGLPITFSENNVDYVVDVNKKDGTDKIKKEKEVVISHPGPVSKSQIPATAVDTKKDIAVLIKDEKKSSPVLQQKEKTDSTRINVELLTKSQSVSKSQIPTTVVDTKKDIAVLIKDEKKPSPALRQIENKDSLKPMIELVSILPTVSKSQIPTAKANARKDVAVLRVEKKSSPVLLPQPKIDTVKATQGTVNNLSVNKSQKPATVIEPKKDVAVLMKDVNRSTPALQQKEKQAVTTQAVNKPLPADKINIPKSDVNTSQQTIKKPDNKILPGQKDNRESQPVKNTAPVNPQDIKTNTALTQPIKNNTTLEKPKEQVSIVPKPLPQSTVLPGPVISSEDLAKRKIETIRSVDFKTDSLVLTLYDNGEVDGDIVSVILNGRVIMSKQMLTTKAITKTIYMTPDLGDSLQLILYAENLGSIAPNTGLLIIKDGDESYQVRFSGDLQKNAAIILRRKHN